MVGLIEAADSGLIPSRVKPTTVTLVFAAFRLDARHETDRVENKLVRLLVVSLGKVYLGVVGYS